MNKVLHADTVAQDFNINTERAAIAEGRPAAHFPNCKRANLTTCLVLHTFDSSKGYRHPTVASTEVELLSPEIVRTRNVQ